MFASTGRDVDGGRTIGRRAFLGTSGAALAGLALWKYEKDEPASVEAAMVPGPQVCAIA